MSAATKIPMITPVYADEAVQEKKRHDKRRRNEGRSSRFVGIPEQPSTPAPTGSLFK